MNPHQLMQRLQRTLLGIGCITGGCAALVGLLATNSRAPLPFSIFESTASASESVTADAVTTTSDASNKPTELQLAPQERVVIPPGRPAWVEADFTHEKSDVHRLAISSGPYKRKHDALRGLDEELVSATSHFVADYLGSETAATLVPVDIHTIRRDLLPGSNVYHEQLEIAELGPMWQSHALLEFSPGFKQQLDERWRKIVVTGRLAKFGVIAVGVLMALSVVLGYFKADTATRGYYTTRLQVGTAGAILALVAGAVMLLGYI